MFSQEDVQDIYPLSPMQEGMFFHANYEKESLAYREQMSYVLQGKLDLDFVKKSFNELLKRHDILRTAFIQKSKNRSLQVVLKERKIDFFTKDIRDLNDQKDVRNDFKEKDKLVGYDLAKDVLMRISILRLADDRYEFIWSNHHILMDGWCRGILIKEFIEIYTSLVQVRTHGLQKTKPYRLYIEWLENQDKALAQEYWREYLEGFREGSFIAENSEHPKKKEFDRETYDFQLDEILTNKLVQQAGNLSTTLSTIIQVSWGVLLSKYYGRKDVVFGVVVSDRPEEIVGVESMIGLFINTVPLRIKFETDTTFASLIDQVHNSSLMSRQYRYYPLSEIQSVSDLKHQLLDHIMVFENYPLAEELEVFEKTENENALFEVDDVHAFEQTNYDFNIIINPGSKLQITFGYNTYSFTENLIQQLSAHLINIIGAIAENAEINICDFSLIQEDEKSKVLNMSERFYENGRLIAKDNLEVIASASYMAQMRSNDSISKQSKNVFILDDKKRMLPIGATGEIFVSDKVDLASGISIEDGIVPDQLQATGDLARWNTSGDIEVIGRSDQKECLFGKNIPLHAIEWLMMSHDEIGNVITFVYESVNKSKHIVAYYESDSIEDEEAIKTYLQTELPDYLVPEYLVNFSKIKEQLTGKIFDKINSKSHFESWILGHQEIGDEVEQKLLQMWQQILDKTEIGRLDNFFSIGGDSLKLTKLFNLIDTDFAELLEVTDLFDNATIHKQASLINSKLTKSTDDSQESDFQVMDF